jgi:hypothetical protein
MIKAGFGSARVATGGERRVEEAQAELERVRAEAAERAAEAATASTPVATRVALESAVRRHREAVATVAKLEVAKRNLADSYWEAFADRIAAETQLAAIRATTAEAMVEIALGDAPAVPRQTVRQAEAELEEAQLRLDNIKAAQAAVDARITDAKGSLDLRATRMRDAATAAIGAQSAAWLATWVAATAKLQQQLADRQNALTWLRNNGVIAEDKTVKQLGLNFAVPVRAWELPEGSVGASVARWEAAVTALCHDPKSRAAQLS